MDISKDPQKAKELVKSAIRTIEKEDIKDQFKPAYLEEISLEELFNGSEEKTQTVSKQLAAMFEYRIGEAFSGILKLNRGSGSDLYYIDSNREVELKTSQARAAKAATFTGNKISTKNCDHLLINYTIDYDAIIEEDNSGIIKELYVGYIKDIDSDWWTSSDSQKSNFAKLNVPKEASNQVTDIFGSSKRGSRYMVFKPEEWS